MSNCNLFHTLTISNGDIINVHRFTGPNMFSYKCNGVYISDTGEFVDTTKLLVVLNKKDGGDGGIRHYNGVLKDSTNCCDCCASWDPPGCQTHGCPTCECEGSYPASGCPKC